MREFSAVSILRRISASILFLVIGLAPLPFGSQDSTVLASWCGLLGVGLILAPFGGLRKQHGWILASIGLVVAGYAFVLHEQLATFPWIAAYHPIWAQVSGLLPVEVTPSASIVRYEPFFALGAPMANILAMALGLLVGTDRRDARRALHVVAWAGAVFAAYGILSLILEPGVILWREKTAYVGSLTGTFINRNTAATYFGSCAALWLLLLLERLDGHGPKGRVTWFARLAGAGMEPAEHRKLVLNSAMLFTCLVALLLTGSRAGDVTSLFVLALAFVVYFRRYLSRRRRLLVGLGGGLAVLLLVLQVLGGTVSARFDLQGLSDEGRVAAWHSTLRIIADHPWFGTGLGTFAWAFPAYRSNSISMWGVWDRAHCTPLELASEIGIPLALLVCAAWVGALSVLAWGSLKRRRDRIVPLSGLCIALLGITHSLIDFSLQIPGYAIVAFGLTGIGLAQAFPSRDGRRGVFDDAVEDRNNVNAARSCGYSAEVK